MEENGRHEEEERYFFVGKEETRTNDESFDEDDLDDGKISNKATKISDAQQHQVEQIVLKAKLESKARLKYAHATDNELCEPKRDGPEVNFPTSKENYEELRQRHSKAAAKTTTKEEKEEEEKKKTKRKRRRRRNGSNRTTRRKRSFITSTHKRERRGGKSRRKRRLRLSETKALSRNTRNSAVKRHE